jgi:hypothetical protein
LTKLSDKLAKAMAQTQEHAQSIHDLIILSPTERIVRGYCFERSSEKDVFYLWKLVVPLYCPTMQNLTLNYSERVSFDELGPLSVKVSGDYVALAQSLMGKLIDKYGVELEELSSIHCFLQKFEHDRESVRPNILLDHAIAHCLIDDQDGARTRLKKILSSQSKSPILPRVQEIAKHVLGTLDEGSLALAEFVKGLEQQNIAVHFPGLLRSLPTRER